MCTGAEIVPLLATLGGTAISSVEQQRALRRQDEEAARGIMQQAEFQREAARRVGENVERIRTSTPEDERRAAQTDFLAALRDRLGGGTDPNLQPAGATSARFGADLAQAQAGVGQETGQLAGRLARVDAPTFQRLREGQGTAATVSDLGLLESEAAQADFLSRLRAASQRPNPFVQGGGQALAAFGGALAGRAQPVKKPPVPKTGSAIPYTPDVRSGLF